MGNGAIASPPENHRVSLLISEAEKRGFFEKYVQPPVDVRLIHGGGSDRSFYRIRGQKGSVILMISSEDDGDFINYVEIARFLKEIGVAVPAVYEADPEECFLFMEDVGDESLYKKVEGVPPLEEIISWYRTVLEVLVHMQVEGGKRWPNFPALPERTFDYHALRWETDYFQKYFLRAYCGVEITRGEELAKEFGILAEKVSREQLHFMHRDFQSQNIMIHNGTPRILDFQGGRRGLLHYDLVSLLKDAYVVLPEEARENLLTFYLEELNRRGVEVKDYEHFYEVFVLAGLQRNMQALGAFSYLSLIKGKGWFKQYIPAGVSYLQEALKKRSDFPVLSAILGRIAPLA
jgi:aminoglycoside/choline kinase family phosphotransferase